MALDVSIGRRWLVGALLVLTGVTGLVDAVSYLGLGRVFVANQTGNVVFIGFALQPDSGLSATASALSIAGFVVGAMLGGRLAAHLGHRPRVWLVTAFTVEAAVFAVVTGLGGTGVLAYRGPHGLVVIATLAVGFGLQTSTVRRLAVTGLNTTVLTLTITGLAADSAIGGGPGARPHRRFGAVLAMCAGAAVGGLLLRFVPVTTVLALSATLVAGVAALLAIAPRPTS